MFSMPFAHDSRGCKRAHDRDSLLFEHSRARVQRCAGRADIVDQHDNPSSKSGYARRGQKRAAHVLLPLRGGEIGLNGSCAHAAQYPRDGKPNVAREVVRLIETALTTACAMERHRHGTGGSVEDLGSSLAHERSEGPSEGAVRVVFQSVHDGP